MRGGRVLGIQGGTILDAIVITATAIAKVFGSDHSTVSYHCKKHESNMEHWPGYRRYFIAAARMCNETMKYKAMQHKLKYVNAQLKRLNKMKNLLEETIKSNQYV